MSQTILENKPTSMCGRAARPAGEAGHFKSLPPASRPARPAGPLDEVRNAAFYPRRERVLRTAMWDPAGFPVRLRPAPALPQPSCQYHFPQYLHKTEAVTRVMYRDTADPGSLQRLLLRRRLDGQ